MLRSWPVQLSKKDTGSAWASAEPPNITSPLASRAATIGSSFNPRCAYVCITEFLFPSLLFALSLGDDGKAVAGGPCLFEGGEGKLLVATVLDAAVVEVHHTGFGVDADDHYEPVFLGVVSRFVPDGFVVESDDHLMPPGCCLGPR